MPQSERLESIKSIIGELVVLHEPFGMVSERVGEMLFAVIGSPGGDRDDRLSASVSSSKQISYIHVLTFSGTKFPSIEAPPRGETLGSPGGTGGKRRRDSFKHAMR